MKRKFKFRQPDLPYFAYGSNILEERLRDRVSHLGIVINKGRRVIEGYELVFNIDGFANITPKEGSSVEGVVYLLNRDQLRMLDMFEGLYWRTMIDGMYAYEGLPWRINKRPPMLPYLNIILDGCLQQGCKKTYNEVLNVKKLTYPNIKSRHKIWK